ncbi:hypothetical protein AAFF_G00324570 [Aldrovandia affinis]|uniref:Uncharacterized protein n=1 Tax=Aldrovandia affinis TaxID=143900 RepID=A0AAD7W0K9_9TELE|nr:hypothetical protein AAFF_G00324570 [Aldrovandia affinis]
MDANASFKDLSDLLEKCKMTHEEYQKYVKALTCGMVIMMKREPKDCWVNGYNPDLLRAWNSNMNIQFILDKFSCIMYMMSYVAKPESPEDTTWILLTEDEHKMFMKKYLRERMKEWICHTCDSHLIKGGMPSIAVANSLELAPVLPELDEFNSSGRVQ